MKYFLPMIVLLTLSLTGVQAAHHAKKPSVKPPKGFVALFDGKSFDGWFTSAGNMRETWSVDSESGVLARTLRNVYIWTDKAYRDFILDLEYKLSRRCNSGVFIRSDPQNPVQGGFEIQLYDDNQPSSDKHSHGSLYDAQAPSSQPAKKVGEWDKMRIRVKGDLIGVWINGTQVIQADLSEWTTAQKNPDGTKNKFKTALNDLPKTGHIGFQDHGRNVAFRNIFLKQL
ncbi:MAG: hypothetical protein CMI18_12215 [Opitutaceae bacterium]|nr:hypothetical protein [Opitutaceae bacterium]|tara:strand:+ start:408 stop:1091 length:684 start_codon:yes stop_codon:yes gene_type:complete